MIIVRTAFKEHIKVSILFYFNNSLMKKILFFHIFHIFCFCYCNKITFSCWNKCDLINGPITFTLIYILQSSAALALYPHRDRLSLFFLSNLRIKAFESCPCFLPSDVNKLFISRRVSEILEALSVFFFFFSLQVLLFTSIHGAVWEKQTVSEC